MAEAEAFADIDALPAEAAGLFDGAAFQSSRAWWRCVTAAALPAGARPQFVLCREAGRPVLLVPMLILPDSRLASLSTPYTVTWQPLAEDGAGAGTLRAAGLALGRWWRRWPVVRLEAADPCWPGWPPLLAGMRAAGYHAARFAQFGNWSESVSDGWPAYLAGRPGALRETIRRKQARVARTPGVSLACARTPEAVAAAIPGYLDVYRRSWKVPEPYPDFDAALLREAAAAGALRLGTLTQDGVTVAAQYWTVANGVATVLKLAHDEAQRALSPGTVLTAWMIAGLIGEGVRALDFGRGDDAYKQLWTTRRSPRVGWVLARPWTVAGAAALGRQWAGAAKRRLRAGDDAIGGAADRP